MKGAKTSLQDLQAKKAEEQKNNSCADLTPQLEVETDRASFKYLLGTLATSLTIRL
jgi:hypothetical protein